MIYLTMFCSAESFKLALPLPDFQVLHSSVEGHKKEIKTLLDKNEGLSSSSSRQEEVARTLTKENLKLQEKISTMEMSERSTRQEVGNLKTLKASLQLEVERLQSEASMRDSIVGNLERINNALQFQEESIKTRLEEENRKLTRDVDSLQVPRIVEANMFAF